MTSQSILILTHPGDDQWPLCEWLEKHGIDPTDIPIPGWITINDEDRTISTEVYVRSEDGQIYMDPVQFREQNIVTPKLEKLVVQLESPALPFPCPTYEIGEHFIFGREPDDD